MVKSKAQTLAGKISLDGKVDIFHHDSFGDIDPCCQVKFKGIKLLRSTGQVAIFAQVAQGRV